MIKIEDGRSIVSDYKYIYVYVVREDTHTLLDIIPKHLYSYDSNVRAREKYSDLYRCSRAHITLLTNKKRALNYKGLF